MTLNSLILKNLSSRAFRTALLILASFVAFFVYGVLDSFGTAITAPADVAATNRLLAVNRISMTQPLPYAYVERIAQIKGVARVSPGTWFAGFFRDPRSEIAVVAVDAASWLDSYPELVMSAAERTAFLQDRTGILVGERMAARLGWKVGDSVPLGSNFWARADGSLAWPVTIRGIFRGKDARTNTDRAYLHYEYLDDARLFMKGQVQQITILTTSPEVNEAVINAIDAMTANSASETETSVESAVRLAMVAQVGNVGLILRFVMVAAFCSLLLIVGNAMVMSIRQRIKEIGILRTLGFRTPHILLLIFGETVSVSLAGCALGLAAAAAGVGLLAGPLRGITPALAFSPATAASALGIAILVGAAAGLVPGVIAIRLRLVNALART